MQWPAVHRDLHSFPTRRSSDLLRVEQYAQVVPRPRFERREALLFGRGRRRNNSATRRSDRKSTRLNSSHITTSYAVFCLKKKTTLTSLYPNVASSPRPSSHVVI